MVKGFFEDLAKARKSEALVMNVLADKAPDYEFELIGDGWLQHWGDIRVSTPSGDVHYIEVKDDSCIHKTGNVLCEEAVYYGDSGNTYDGNMYSNYEIYCVLSQAQRKIYVIDFSVLRANYKLGEYKEIPHPQQTTYAYLVGLWQIKKWGGLIATIEY